LIFINNELNQNDSFLYTAEQSEAKHEAKVGGIKIIKNKQFAFPTHPAPGSFGTPQCVRECCKVYFLFFGGPQVFVVCVKK
jgi:hypothetical protein